MTMKRKEEKNEMTKIVFIIFENHLHVYKCFICLLYKL